MFEAVPHRYDFLNRLLTLRYDEHWRALAAKRCLEDKPQRVLDLCCGTGDLTWHLRRQSKREIELHGLDYSGGMLELAQRKNPDGVELHEGNATQMPFPDNHFDSVGIAYAFRNLTWKNPLKDSALAEVLRVLKPGGRFVIIETSQPRNSLWRWIFHTYLRLFAAPVGSMISGHGEAYRYLSLSARHFHNADEVSAMLMKAGFREVSATRLLGGIAALHLAVKPR